MTVKWLCIGVLFFSLHQNTNEETLIWKATKKLTWADFKGKPIANSNAAALTASGITFGYSVKTANNRIIDYTTSVEAHFYPNKSWYKTTNATPYILAHEQLHFDITELYARKFRQQISKLKLNQNIKSQLKRLHTAINKALSNTQNKYDEQTHHSINKKAQAQWQTYIAAELKKLDAYK